MSKIIIYSKPGCGQCYFTRKFLEKNHINFEERDVSLKVEWLHQLSQLGFKSVPIIIGPNQEVIQGYRPDTMLQWRELNG